MDCLSTNLLQLTGVSSTTFCFKGGEGLVTKIYSDLILV